MLACADCGFDVWKPVAQFRVSVLGFYPDARFPGRCLLPFTGSHVVQIDDIPEQDTHAFMSDILTSIRIIKQVTGVERVNVAVLGNTVNHVHAHLVPRNPEKEPFPDRPPWEDPREKTMGGEETELWWAKLCAAAERAYTPRPHQ